MNEKSREDLIANQARHDAYQKAAAIARHEQDRMLAAAEQAQTEEDRYLWKCRAGTANEILTGINKLIELENNKGL